MCCPRSSIVSRRPRPASDVKKGIDALFTAENLQGLPPVFGTLGLSATRRARRSSMSRAAPLTEVIDRIEERANYGDTASGRYLADEFAKEPFGWDFEVVRLLVLWLLRAGKIEATSKGQTIDTATGVEARTPSRTTTCSGRRRSARRRASSSRSSSRRRKPSATRSAARSASSNAGAIVAELRKEVACHEDTVAAAHGAAHCASPSWRRCPRRRHRPNEGHPARHRGQCHRDIQRVAPAIKDAIKRAAELEQALTEPRLATWSGRGRCSGPCGPSSGRKPDITDDLRAQGDGLEDLLARETFFQELPAIEQYTRGIEAEYERRYDEALDARVRGIQRPSIDLCKTPGWTDSTRTSSGSSRRRSSEASTRGSERLPIPQLRSERDACDARLRAAVRSCAGSSTASASSP